MKLSTKREISNGIAGLSVYFVFLKDTISENIKGISGIVEHIVYILAGYTIVLVVLIFVFVPAHFIIGNLEDVKNIDISKTSIIISTTIIFVCIIKLINS